MVFMKYFRYSYLDLIEDSKIDSDCKRIYACLITSCFDKIEVGYISEIEVQQTIPDTLIEKNYYLSVFNNFIEPAILFDKDSRLVNFNAAAYELFPGINSKDNSVLDLTLNELTCKIQEFTMNPDLEKSFESIIDSKTEQLYYQVFFKKLMNMDNQFQGSIVIFQDLTKQHSTETNLYKAKVRAEDANRLKTAFLANMSHEIRTPMNAIVGFTELLLNHKYTENNKREYLKLIRRSSNDLLNLIEDIIDVAKMESKTLKVKYKACKPFEVLTDLKTVFTETLHQYGTNDTIDLRMNVQKSQEDIVFYTDGERLKQVMANLLNNAVKFTNEGFIEFGYRVSDNSKLSFFVKDSGIGIPKEMRNRIFERFVQVDEHLTNNNGGAGLGLAICKNIINLLGGSLWVESSVGKGSDFYFELPLREVPQQVQKHGISSIIDSKKKFHLLEGKVILIAEDDEINFLLIKEILAKTGAKILHAKDGIEAVNYAETQGGIDIILMDIKMPGVNGLKASQYISTIRPGIPIIAQTAYAMEGDRVKCINAGCCDYITKPIESEKLLKLIDQYVSMKKSVNDNYLINHK